MTICIYHGNCADGFGLEMAAYLCGGPFGIVAAMAVFRRWRAKP